MSVGSSTTVRSGIWDAHQWRMWLAGLIGARYDGLHHFHIVRPGVLMRSGQPRVRDLEHIRTTQGLKTIICARGGTRHPLRGRWFRKERAYCQQANIRFEHMPFSDAAVPPAEIFDRFLAIVRDPANCPVLVHCEQGFHRTGILSAAFRIAVEGWSLERAIREMDENGFESHKPKRHALRDALVNWAKQHTAPGDH